MPTDTLDDRAAVAFAADVTADADDPRGVVATLAVAPPQSVAPVVQFREHCLAPAPCGLERFLLAPVDAIAEVLDRDPMAPLHLHAPGVGARAIVVNALQVMVAGGGHSERLPPEESKEKINLSRFLLKSPRAVAVNIEIMRAFVRLREMLASNKELARKLNELERKLGAHDQAIASILSAIRELMAPPEPPKKRRMGFIQDEE